MKKTVQVGLRNRPHTTTVLVKHPTETQTALQLGVVVTWSDSTEMNRVECPPVTDQSENFIL